ncbi:MAG: hypothetical protein P8008_03205, partial [Gammaproteobacteria bacterium]
MRQCSLATRLMATTAFLALLTTAPASAQDTDDDEPNGLFDDDVELSEGGWPRFTLSAGWTRLDADGTYRLALPDGRQVTVLDFERIGLTDRDSSYWFSGSWRSRTSRWGAWFAAWDFSADGARTWEDEWSVDGREIPVGARVATTFDARWYVLEA